MLRWALATLARTLDYNSDESSALPIYTILMILSSLHKGQVPTVKLGLMFLTERFMKWTNMQYISFMTQECTAYIKMNAFIAFHLSF